MTSPTKVAKVRLEEIEVMALPSGVGQRGVGSLAWSPDGRKIFFAGYGVGVWDASSAMED